MNEGGPLRVGLIGIGAIASVVAEGLAAGLVPGARLHGVAGRPSHQAELGALAQRFACVTTTAPADLPAIGAQVVLEAAGVSAAREFAPAILEQGVDVVLMSVGVLADASFRARLADIATRRRCRIHVPSGGIAGLDGARAAAVGDLTEVTVTTRKAPASLRGAPYLEAKAIDLDSITEPTVIFEGTAAEAIAGFPANVNVSVALGFAIGNPDGVRVRLVAEPGLSEFAQDIRLAGDFGSIEVSVRGRPSATNPRTSRLAGLSALSTLRRLTSPIQIG